MIDICDKSCRFSSWQFCHKNVDFTISFALKIIFLDFNISKNLQCNLIQNISWYTCNYSSKNNVPYWKIISLQKEGQKWNIILIS